MLKVVHIRTIHLGPDDVMCGLKLTFNPDLDMRTLELRINELEAQLRAELPHLTPHLRRARLRRARAREARRRRR